MPTIYLAFLIQIVIFQQIDFIKKKKIKRHQESNENISLNCWVSSFTVIVKTVSTVMGLGKKLHELLPNHTHCSFRIGKIPNTKFTEWSTAVAPGCSPFPLSSPSEPFTGAKTHPLAILGQHSQTIGTNSLRS